MLAIKKNKFLWTLRFARSSYRCKHKGSYSDHSGRLSHRVIFKERGKIMMNISMQSVFNDLNGRIIYKPYNSFEAYAKEGKSDLEKLRR